MTAYEIGCEALAALGYAHKTEGGAVPRGSPALPEVLPRSDDVAVAVLYLAAQNGLIRYLPPGADTQSSSGLPAMISPAHGLGLAHADSEAASVLEALGLIKGGKWTKAAETVLWRDSPEEWSIDFVNDIRFIEAASDACERMPSSVREDIERVVEANEGDLRGPRRYDLDDLFFRLWRLDDGWLSPTETKRALAIFHDPLAIAIRRAVMSRVFPGRL